VDWIETFVRDTEGIQSPLSFRLWTAITTVAGVLERRVWTETDKGPLYTNLFVLLSGVPASGKSLMVGQARKLWTDTTGSGQERLHVGPDNPTKKSFLDFLEKSVRTYTNGTGITVFSAMSMACSEFSVLFSKAESQFFGDMTSLYDNLDQYFAPRADKSKSVDITKPTVNILAGVTPDFLADLLPESAWGQGFTSRLMFIYGSKVENPDRDVFAKRPKDTHELLQNELKKMFQIGGEMLWDDDAQKALNQWFAEGLPPKPDYGRLVHYAGRREAHVLKLAMISAISYHQKLTVTLGDFERAKKWLLDAEVTMPDVFKAMRQKSDSQLLQDMHQWTYAKWAGIVHDKRKPLKEELLWEFFSERTTSDKIDRLIQAAYRSGIIRQGTTPNTFVPRPRNEQ